MPTPFYNAIKGTTSGAPGTGAFTPNAASSGYRAWSNVPTGWIGMVRFEDGSAWELSYSYWNGTTLSRSANQLYDSSTGSALTLSSSATAEMIADAFELVPSLIVTSWGANIPAPNSATITSIGANNSDLGTGSAIAPAATNFYTQQRRKRYTSATTAASVCGNAMGGAFHGFSSSTAGLGGVLHEAEFGAATLPTGPRLRVGLVPLTWSSTGIADPSSLVSNYAFFAKDVADTNIQLMTNNGTAAPCAKIDTGIPWVANSWYRTKVWIEPGSTKVYALIFRSDTGDIWYQTTTTRVPVSGTGLGGECAGATGTATGTAMVFDFGGQACRSGF